MSDELDVYDYEKLKSTLRVDFNDSLTYVRQRYVNTSEISFTIHINNHCLKRWHDISRTRKVQLTEILNVFLGAKYGLQVKENSKRLEEQLRKRSSEANSSLRGKTGRKYKQVKTAVRSIHVFTNETLNARDIQLELQRQKTQNEILEKDNEKLEERCEELFQEIVNMKQCQREVEEEQEKLFKDIETLENENEYLRKYVDKIQELEEMTNTSKRLDQVKDRQQRRKIKELKTNVERALWFAKTLGLKLASVTFKSTNDKDSVYQLDYDNEESAQGQRKSFKDLSPEDKEKVQQILYLADRFCIGEAAYHELCMAPGGEGLPRSYLIKQCKTQLNSICHITRTPGEAEGAEVDFEKELKDQLIKQVNVNDFKDNNNNSKVKIKISGDGAKMTRLTSFVIMSFSILESDDVMSSKGNHTIAVVKGQESYNLLKSSCANIFSTVNRLIKEGKTTIDGIDVPLEIFLGGDLKFLLLILGMKGATADYACIWCTCHKNDRHDMTKPEDCYWESPKVRTLKLIKEYVVQKKFSCEHPPLLNIPLENVILDELHLMLRITDVLTKNIVNEVLDWDYKDNFNKPPSKRTTTHTDTLLEAIRSLGISFNIWEKKDANGKGSGTYDFTSLMGTDKKILLKDLPSKLTNILRPETSDTVVQLWKDFDELYKMLGQRNPTQEQVSEYFGKAKAWVNLFKSLGGKREGYEKARVTPYMHAMVYHVPRFMRKQNGIKKFTGQGVEKNNDDCRRIHLTKSNRWDAAKDVLLVGKRMELLSSSERTPRQYNKRSNCYWGTGIKESRAKRARLCTQQVTTTTDNVMESDTELTPDILKSRLRDMGVKTRARSMKRLQELYEIALQSAASE